MQDGSSSPTFLIEAMFFVLRCIVPLLLLLGVSYLLKRLGLIKPPPPPPSGWDNGGNGNNGKNGNDKTNGGGVAHGKA